MQMTKCGRFGSAQFDYSPASVRRSVLQSLQRLNTTYLDVVYLHDIEFVAEGVGYGTPGSGFHGQGLTDKREEYGLAPGQEGQVRGPGDEQILAGIGELRKLKEEGLVKAIGITGRLFCSRTSDHRVPPSNASPFIVVGFAHRTLSAAGHCSLLFTSQPAKRNTAVVLA